MVGIQGHGAIVLFSNISLLLINFEGRVDIWLFLWLCFVAVTEWLSRSYSHVVIDNFVRLCYYWTIYLRLCWNWLDFRVMLLLTRFQVYFVLHIILLLGKVVFKDIMSLGNSRLSSIDYFIITHLSRIYSLYNFHG